MYPVKASISSITIVNICIYMTVDGIKPQHVKKPTNTSDTPNTSGTQDEMIFSNQNRVDDENTDPLTAGRECQYKIFWSVTAINS